MTDPAELTVSELESHVSDVDDPNELERLREAEIASDDRVTAKEAIDERLDELDAADDADESAADALDDAKEVLEGKEAAKAADEAKQYVTVKNPRGRGAHIASHSFEPYEIKRVVVTNQVRGALRHGELQTIKT